MLKVLEILLLSIIVYTVILFYSTVFESVGILWIFFFTAEVKEWKIKIKKKIGNNMKEWVFPFFIDIYLLFITFFVFLF